MVNGNGRRVVGGPVLALAALAALAVWPLLRAGYPTIGDGLNHFYRLVEFEHLLQHGDLFPRWATDLGYGYGYPLFNYTAPLAYYLGAIFHGLGLNDANSLLAVYVTGWLLAVSGAYRLARERGGPAAAFVAAAAYGLAPYLYFNALARGALPETLGLGWLPWVLWVFYRLAVRPSRYLLLSGALLYAALVLTHLLTALLAIPLIALFWLIAILNRLANLSPRPPSPILPIQDHGKGVPLDLKGGVSSLGRVWAVLITDYQLPATILLAVGLASYFVVPALLETRYVQIGQLTQPGALDFRNNFLQPAELLALPQPFDARLVFREVPPSLSLAALALAVLGLARRAWRARRGERSLEAWDGGLWLGLIGLSLLTLGFTQPVWEHLPDANLIQFPWRLVGPASLLLALLAARAIEIEPPVAAPESGRRTPWALLRGLAPALVLAGLVLYSLTWTFSAGPPAPISASVRDLTGYEHSSGQLGTTSAGEFLPVDVTKLPDAHSLEGAYALHSVIERLGALPAGISLESQDATITSASAVITAQAPAQLTFDWFDFPGWRATVDGQRVAITASQPNGLITIPVPAGRHSIQVAFASTPLRTAAEAVSLLAFAILVCLTLMALSLARRNATRLSLAKPAVVQSPTYSPTPTPTRPDFADDPAYSGSKTSPALLMALTAVGLIVVRVLAIDGRDTLFAHSRFDGQHVAGAGQAFDANFDDQLVLIGLDLPARQVAADTALPVTLYWRAQNVPAVDYSTTLQVLDDDGNLWGQSDSQNPGRLPTSRWGAGQYARDGHVLRLRPGTPPGRYNLVAGVYAVGGAALSVLDANRVPHGQTASLGALTVTRAQSPPTAIGAAQPAAVALGPLTYLGDSVSSVEPQAGDELTLELFWRAEGAARPNLTMHLGLVGAAGSLIQAWDVPPARSDYPTADWAQGEIVRSVQRLRLPANAPAGSATLQLSLRPGVGGRGAPPPGPVQIATLNLRVPLRSFAVPPIAHVLNTMLGQPVRLLGYDLNPDEVTLYWQAVAGMDTSYSVFVHALDAGGTILNQVDALPLNGARPTTGWLPEEVLADRYALPLAGAKTLEVGLYDPTTRQRLGTASITLP